MPFWDHSIDLVVMTHRPARRFRDGLVCGDKQPERGRWYIPVTDLDWWLRPK